MNSADDDLADIENRNRIRRDAGLPLLSVSDELDRMKVVREGARFELEWAKRRPEFAHLWEGNRGGWITGMGRYSLARQKVRREMQSNKSDE